MQSLRRVGIFPPTRRETEMKKLLSLAAAACVLFSFSTADADLLGIREIIGAQYPDIVFDNAGRITYDAATDEFILDADDLRIVYAGGTFDWLCGPGVEVDVIIDLDVDDTGELIGTGTMIERIVMGEVTVGGHTYNSTDPSTILLAGDVWAFGWGESGAELGMFDFQINNLSGLLVDDDIWPDDVDTGVFALAENLGGWTGSWGEDFDLGKVKGNKAPVPEPGTLVLLSLGAVGILFRRRRA